MNLKWYRFGQNNSGGRFVVNDKVDADVYIQTTSAKEANRVAEDVVGIYFNGVSDGIDCECCGDRWSRQYDNDGDEYPTKYGQRAITGKFYPYGALTPVDLESIYPTQ